MRMNGINNHAEYHDDSVTAANALMLREKIISTDRLIKSYNDERQANEKNANKVNELLKTVSQLNKECMKYENQLSEILQEVQPYKKSIKELQEQNSKYAKQIKELENKLVAGEKLTQQYEALLKSKEEQKDQNYVKKEEVDKRIGKKEKEIKMIKERLTKAKKKLQDRRTRSKKMLKGYNTSVRHLLKFGKNLIKQKAASNVDQKIIEYYSNIISKNKSRILQDENELDFLQLPEDNNESNAELSDSSFEVVEERIISSPYTPSKSTPSKVLTDFSSSPSPKRKCTQLLVLTPRKNYDETGKSEKSHASNTEQVIFNSSVHVTPKKDTDTEMEKTDNFEAAELLPQRISTKHTEPEMNEVNAGNFEAAKCVPLQADKDSEIKLITDNIESAKCMPVINDSGICSGSVHSNSEKPLIDTDENNEWTETYANSIKSTETSNFNSRAAKTYENNEGFLDSYKTQSVENQQNAQDSLEKAILCDETCNTDDIDNSHKEMEEEIARITYDMCHQGIHFHPLSPLPPTPPPKNVKETGVTSECSNELIIDDANTSKTLHKQINNTSQKLKRKLDFNSCSTNVSENGIFDKTTEHMNGTQKLHHQQSQGFEVLPDDRSYTSPTTDAQFAQSGQYQNQPSISNSITGDCVSNNSPAPCKHPISQQPFQANILHCPIDGNFKINIRMANAPNEKADHKITSLNLEVNNVTREFNISCSKIPCEYNNITETAKCPCCTNNLTEQFPRMHQTVESRLTQEVETSHPLPMRAKASGDKVGTTILSPPKSTTRAPDTDKLKKHSERYNRYDETRDIIEDAFNIPSSDVAEHTFQESTLTVLDGLQKTGETNKSSSVMMVSSCISSSAPKELEAFPLKRQTFHDVSCAGRQQISAKKTPVEPTKPRQRKQSHSATDSMSCIKKTKPSSPIKKSESIIQDSSTAQTKSLNKQKNAPSVELTNASLKKQKCYDANKVNAADEKQKFATAKKDFNEIFPISRKLANNKRSLNDTSNEDSIAESRTDTSVEKPQQLAKRCKINTKVDIMPNIDDPVRCKADIPTVDDSVVNHFSKLGRNIFDVKSSIPKTMEEIQKLKQGSSVNKAFSRMLQLKLANPHHTLSTDAFVQSALIFLAKTQQNLFITFSSESSPPLLTDFERNLLAVVHFLENKCYNHLRNLTTGLKIALSSCIFNNKTKHHKLFGTASMCRAYVALCRQTAGLEEARLLCYDLFCKLPDSALYLVTAAVSVWPDILVKQKSVAENSLKVNVLQTVYSYLLLKGSHTLNKTLFGQCMTVLNTLCDISSSFIDIVSLGKHVIGTFEDLCTEEIHDVSSEMKLVLTEASMAVELLAIQARLLSQLKEFFDDLLVPTFKKWRDQLVHRTKKYETLVTFWLKLFGVIGHHCFQAQKDCFENCITLLCDLLVSLEASVTVQESAFICLLTLQPLRKQSYLQKISDWLLQHEQNLSDDGKEFIEKIKLKLVLTTLPRKEQLT